MKFSDKCTILLDRIIGLFVETSRRYDYCRIHALLAKEGIHISEKIVHKIMSESELKVKTKRKNKYRFYMGEISYAVSNVMKRNIHDELPNTKQLTDITELARHTHHS